MDIIKSIISGTAGQLITDIGSTVRKFITTDGDRMAMQTELEKILQKRDSEIEQTIRTELSAKADIIKAEMQSGDNFTRRARPSVVYFGLIMIALDLFLRVWKGMEVSTLLPQEFWIAWGGIVSTWVVGRSAEKRGVRNKVVDFLTK